MSSGNEAPNGLSGPAGESIVDLRERVTALETNMSHLATKAWVLGGVIFGMITTAALLIAGLKLLP